MSTLLKKLASTLCVNSSQLELWLVYFIEEVDWAARAIASSFTLPMVSPQKPSILPDRLQKQIRSGGRRLRIISGSRNSRETEHHPRDRLMEVAFGTELAFTEWWLYSRRRAVKFVLADGRALCANDN